MAPKNFLTVVNNSVPHEISSLYKQQMAHVLQRHLSVVLPIKIEVLLHVYRLLDLKIMTYTVKTFTIKLYKVTVAKINHCHNFLLLLLLLLFPIIKILTHHLFISFCTAGDLCCNCTVIVITNESCIVLLSVIVLHYGWNLEMHARLNIYQCGK